MRKHWNLVSKKSSTKVQEELDEGIERDFISKVMLHIYSDGLGVEASLWTDRYR